MLSLRIAGRFLLRSRAQSVFIVLGIAVGIGVQVFVGSLIGSLQKSLIDRTIGSSPQITVAGTGGFPFEYTPQLQTTMTSTPGVTTVVPQRTFSAILKRGGDSAPLNVTGGDLGSLDSLYKLSSRVTAGTASLQGSDAIIGKGVAATFALKPGDLMTLVLPDGSSTKVAVSAVVDLAQAQANAQSAFVSAESAARALKLTPTQYTSVAAQLRDPFRSVKVADEWRAQPQFADLTVGEWQSQNQDLLQALKSQSSSSYMIQVFVLVAVALGIASTLAISAVQKTRQIGILKAMGMADAPSARIFFWQAAVLGVTGAALGVAVGLGLVGVFDLAGRGSSSFPIRPEPWFVLISFAVGVAVALLSAIIPVRRTSRVDPIEVIQSV